MLKMIFFYVIDIQNGCFRLLFQLSIRLSVYLLGLYALNIYRYTDNSFNWQSAHRSVCSSRESLYIPGVQAQLSPLWKPLKTDHELVLMYDLYNTRTKFLAPKISLPKIDFLLVFLVSKNWLKLGPVQTQNLTKNHDIIN